jgi:hypothetical protein
MSKSRLYLGEYVSLRDDLSELESDFLSLELRKNPYRSSFVLKNTARRKASVQRVKWVLQDTMVTAGIATVMLGIVGVIIILLV